MNNFVNRQNQVKIGAVKYGSAVSNADSFDEDSIERDDEGKFSFTTGKGKIQKQPWDESTKDTPEFDIKKSKKKEAKIKKDLEKAKEKLADLNEKSEKISGLEKKRDEARARKEEAEKKLKESKARVKELKAKLKKKNDIDGGVGDDKLPSDFDPDILQEGVDVEMEHTDDLRIAQEIAMDHLTEDINYYKKLKKVEA